MEHIHDILKQGELSGLLFELQKIKRLNQAIRPLLPEPFREGCFISRIEKGSATLDVPNGSMATMIRYQLPTILGELRVNKDWMGLASIKIRVNPPLNLGETTPLASSQKARSFSPISDETRQQLIEAANTFEDDELRLAFLGLVSHIK